MTASPDPSPPILALTRYVEDSRALIVGNSVKLLRNGAEAFPAWIAAIDDAKKRVSLEMYIFSDDGIGRQFSEALSRAAQRGVEVRLLYDFVGCRDTPAAFFQRMRGFGVHVVGYHKYRFWRPRLWSLIRRNHRKTLVCDGGLAFTGGINISNEWVSQAEGGGGWLDAAVAVEGPAAARIEATFLRTWNRRAPKRMRLDPDRLAVPQTAGGVALAVVSNSELRDRFVIRRAALHAIRESRQRILLANPYFVPDQGVLRALQSAARRGVDVRLLVPLASDSRLLDFATRAVFPQLLAAAARIFRSQVVTHTKALMVDDTFFSIGSYNFDHRSLAYNLELVVNVVDPTTAVEVGTMLISDMAASEELTAAAFARRGWLERLIERIAYGLRRWL
ncbi:MAG TPA: phospholipase D-like domain-containing protein [Polyangia bacterium]|jgi:cardiolipin synthase|nr:phospholipase D-like domain-containing protein [Polyangia bacterium]